MATISALIHTYNEELNIANCLRSLAFCDEIIVVDMQSTDLTCQVATELGARVVSHENLGYADPARSFGINITKGDWVLMVDADEMLTKALAQKLIEKSKDETLDGLWLPRENYLFGKLIEETGWGAQADAQLRFFRRGKVTISGAVHCPAEPLPGARVERLPYRPGLALVHFNYLDIEHWFEKMNRYTSIGAKAAYAEGERWNFNIWQLSVWSLRAFLGRYLKRKGYRDGLHGLVLSILITIYLIEIKLKLWELSAGLSRAENRRRYEAIAEKLLSESVP